MQSVVRSSTAMKNPLMGSTMSYRVAAAPMPSQTAVRQVATMAKKKGVRIIVTLECTEAKSTGATPSRYCTQKVPHRSCSSICCNVVARRRY
jgi:large subunit ribosomal protein L33